MHLHKAQEPSLSLTQDILYICVAHVLISDCHDSRFQTKQSRQVFEKGRAILSTLP